MRKRFTKTSAWKYLMYFMLVICLTGGTCGSVLAESYTGDTLRLLHYEGTVEIEDESGSPRFVMENVRFNSGESMRTGAASSASVSLDSTKIVTLGEESRVQFTGEGSHMQMTLTDGTMLLDVSEKLGADETLDIQTSTMTVGIRGTIVFVEDHPAEGGAGITAGPGMQKADDPASEAKVYIDSPAVSEAGNAAAAEEGAAALPAKLAGPRITTLGILEGTAKISYTDTAGTAHEMSVPAGQAVSLTASHEDGRVDVEVKPIVTELTIENVNSFVVDQIIRSPERFGRSVAANDWLFADSLAWTWTDEVTLVAQSASKLYDGLPLRRTSDVLVYGLPKGLSIQAAANGSRTEAGESENPVSSYAIYNSAGEDVTDHFTNIRTVSGQLVIDPLPLTVWTGSAEKVYDGTPLTNPEALLRTVPGYEKDMPTWRNTSHVIEDAGSQTLYGVSGTVWVHGTNPLTEETREIELQAGQKMVVQLKDKNDASSIDFKIESISEAEIPDDILLLYAANPELLAQACLDAGWNPELIQERIQALLEKMEKAENTQGLSQEISQISQAVQSGQTVQAGQTTVTGQGAQSGQNTPTGQAVQAGQNTVTGQDAQSGQISAGTSASQAPLVTQYTVEKNGLIVAGSMASSLMMDSTNVRIHVDTEITDYSSRALNSDEAHFVPVGIDESIKVTAPGSQTEVGESPNTYDLDWGNANPNNYILNEDLGTLKVTAPAEEKEPEEKPTYDMPVVLKSASAEKVYDGTPLADSSVSADGLPEGFYADVTVTGSRTEAGSEENTITGYRILNDSGEDVTEDFTNVTLAAGTLTVEPLQLECSMGGAEVDYSGAFSFPDAVIIYLNGPHAGESVSGTRSGSRLAGQDDVSPYTLLFTLFTGDQIQLTVQGGGTDAGTYTLEGIFQAVSGIDANFTVSYSSTEITVKLAEVVVTTGSASKEYDGKELTSSEASISGLAPADAGVKVTATGSITEIGTAQNTYTIDWGSAKASNYTITENLGTLEITNNAAKITFTAGSAEKVYDGTPLDGSALEGGSVTADGLPEGFTFTAEAAGSQTDAGTTANTVVSYKIFDADGNDVTSRFSGIATADGTLTVSPAAAAITTGSASKEFDGKALANAEASISGLAAADAGVKVTATGTITEIGTAENTYTIDWGTVKASNYTLTESLGTLEITKNTAKITFTAGSAEKVYDGTPLDGSALEGGSVTADGLPEGFTFTAEAAGSQTDAGTAVNTVASYKILDANGSDVTSRFSGIATTDGTLTVLPAAATVTTGSASKEYDGKELTSSEASISGLASADAGVTVTATGAITEIGTAENTYTIDWGSAKASNYTLTETPGTLQVTENTAAITFTAASSEKVYDGTPLDGSALGDGSVTVTGLPDGFTFTAEAAGSQTDAGTGTNTVASYKILDTGGNDVTSRFSGITTADGTLTVSPAEITISTGSGSKEFDGTALTNAEASIAGLADADSDVTIAATGTITDMGSTDNTYTIDWGTAKASNYTVTESLGTLEITACTKPIVITAKSGEKVYDGTPLEVDLVDCEGLPEGFVAWVWPTGSQTDAGTSANKVNDDFEIHEDGDEEHNIRSYFTNITLKDGTLTVTPATLSISTGYAEKQYDGTPLTCSDITVKGLVSADDGVVIAASGSITDVGTADNTYSIEWGSSNSGNYIISEGTIGTLKVTPLEVTFDFNAPTALLDGYPHYTSTITGTYEDGSSVECTESYEKYANVGDPAPEYIQHTFTLVGGATISFKCFGHTEIGSYTHPDPGQTTMTGNKDNYNIQYTNNVLKIEEKVYSTE